jgi:GNAT superfamily N-acetyltransferase
MRSAQGDAEQVFRTAAPSDSQRIVELHAASWRAAYRPYLSAAYLDADIVAERGRIWQERFAQPTERQLVLLAEEAGTLVGFACVLLDEESASGACLDNLHVQPGLTGCGLGSELPVQSAQWVAQVEPGWPLHLWVIEVNTAARRFYERHGGECAEQATKRMPDGSQLAVYPYLWPVPARLLGVSSAG